MIHLIITTANIPQAYSFRKAQYKNSIDTCLRYRHYYDEYTVLECYSKHEDYLTPYHTHYSHVGNPFLNKGLNEMSHLAHYLTNSSINNHDIVIKLTGRYLFENGYFFENVLSMCEKFDGFFKDDGDIYIGKGYHTFCYAVRKATFMKIHETINFSMHNEEPIEWGFKKFLVDKNVLLLQKLNLIAFQGTYSDRIFRC